MACKQIQTHDPSFDSKEHDHLYVLKGGPHIAEVIGDIEWNPRTAILSIFMEYYEGKDLDQQIHIMHSIE